MGAEDSGSPTAGRDVEARVDGEAERGVPPRPTAGSELSKPDSGRWVEELSTEGRVRDDAVARLHALLLRAARFEVKRRRGSLPHLRGDELEDIAHQSADDAVVAVLGKLGDFRGESLFTTWAYKFALLETAVNLRRRAWQGRETPLEPESWPHFDDPHASPEADAERSELMAAIGDAVATALTPHQRHVLVSVALNDVPIDVLADRLGTTRGALYKTIHDARRKLRTKLAESGLEVAAAGEGARP